MKKRILILCTGNSCRSQMAEGFLKAFDPGLEVFSAGTNPSSRVNPNAVRVMAEKGIDISQGQPKDVEQFLHEPFDYVITVCGNAKETCPVFTGKVHNRLHIGFDDPADASGTEEEILSEFRRVRDEIERDFQKFYHAIQRVKVEIQLFDGCPNSGEMINRVREAINQLGINVEYSETYVETPEIARRVKFRGSPTLLVNGADIENLPEPETASLACRFYKDGLPSVERIKEFIMQHIK